MSRGFWKVLCILLKKFPDFTCKRRGIVILNTHTKLCKSFRNQKEKQATKVKKSPQNYRKFRGNFEVNLKRFSNDFIDLMLIKLYNELK